MYKLFFILFVIINSNIIVFQGYRTQQLTRMSALYYTTYLTIRYLLIINSIEK